MMSAEVKPLVKAARLLYRRQEIFIYQMLQLQYVMLVILFCFCSIRENNAHHHQN